MFSGTLLITPHADSPQWASLIYIRQLSCRGSAHLAAMMQSERGASCSKIC